MPRKESTASAQLRQTINQLDQEGPGAQKANTFFDQVDRDGDGSIDRAEFGKVYDLLQDHVREEHRQEKEAEKKISNAKRRVKLMGSMLVVLFIVLAISIVGNFLTTDAVIKMSKDQYVNNGIVTSKDGKPISQGAAVELFAFPALLNPGGREVARNLEEITLNHGKPDELNFKLIGYNYSGTVDEPNLELYGIRNKVCINKEWHVALDINVPCPTEMDTARKLSPRFRKLEAGNGCSCANCGEAPCGNCGKGGWYAPGRMCAPDSATARVTSAD